MTQLLVAPLQALTDPELSDPERRVLLALFSYRDKTSNTVWPSVDTIATRANVRDRTRISKITRSLSKKGWLTKRKRGFTGYNQYTLTVPDRLTNLDSNATLAPEPNKEDQPKLDAATTSNLDSGTTSNLDSESKCKEHTNEQTNEQITPPAGGALPAIVNDEIGEVVGYALPTNRYATISEVFVVTRDDIRGWEALYPAIDVEQQVRNMIGWLHAHPENRKTFNGMARFIQRWLSKAQNQAPRQNSGSSRRQSLEHDLNDTSWAR
jgi:predicted transcriptional regulator